MADPIAQESFRHSMHYRLVYAPESLQAPHRAHVDKRKAEVSMAARRNADLPVSPDLGPPKDPVRTVLGRAGDPAARSRAAVATEVRQAMIAQAAYLLAEARGFSPGHELEDWLRAETEVDTALAAEGRDPAQKSPPRKTAADVSRSSQS